MKRTAAPYAGARSRATVAQHESIAFFNFRANDARTIVFRNRLDAFEHDEFRSLGVVETESRHRIRESDRARLHEASVDLRHDARRER